MRTRVMLVDDSTDRAAWLRDALDQAGFDVVASVHGMEDLYQRVTDLEPDVVIIESDSAKRDVLESLGSRETRYPRPVVLFSEHNNPAIIGAAYRAGISAYVVGGLSPGGVRSIINVAISQFRQYEHLRNRLEEVETELARQRVLERAKILLMEQEGLTEREAYRRLRKAAMDASKPLVEVARALIKRHGAS